MSGQAVATSFGLRSAIPWTWSVRRLRHPPVWFDKAAFARPANGTWGVQARNGLINPGFRNFDVGLRKNFPTFENQRLQMRFEFFNILNHPNWTGKQQSDQRPVRTGYQQEWQSHDSDRNEVYLLKALST